MVPSRAEAGSAYSARPPEPMLQGVPGHDSNPPEDLREMRQRDSQANDTTQWIDKNSGIAQIPVSEAMKIIAEKGTAGGTTAAAEQKKPEAKKTEPKKAEQKK